HRLAVRELDAGAELERVRLAVLRLRVRRREPGPQRLAIVGCEVERLVDLLRDPDRLVLEDVRLVERLRVLDPRDRDRPAAFWLARAGLVGRRARNSYGRSGCPEGERADH